MQEPNVKCNCFDIKLKSSITCDLIFEQQMMSTFLVQCPSVWDCHH